MSDDKTAEQVEQDRLDDLARQNEEVRRAEHPEEFADDDEDGGAVPVAPASGTGNHSNTTSTTTESLTSSAAPHPLAGASVEAPPADDHPTDAAGSGGAALDTAAGDGHDQGSPVTPSPEKPTAATTPAGHSLPVGDAADVRADELSHLAKLEQAAHNLRERLFGGGDNG